MNTFESKNVFTVFIDCYFTTRVVFPINGGAKAISKPSTAIIFECATMACGVTIVI